MSIELLSRKGMPMRYRYALLRYKPSLHDEAKGEALAVVVESDSAVFIFGREPLSMEKASVIGREALRQLPSMLEAQLKAFGAPPGKASVIEHLANENRWNLSFSQAQEIKAENPIEEVAFMLFARLVLGPSEKLERAATTWQAHSRRDQFFEVAAPASVGA